MSSSLWVVDSVYHLPDRQVKFLEKCGGNEFAETLYNKRYNILELVTRFLG